MTKPKFNDSIVYYGETEDGEIKVCSQDAQKVWAICEKDNSLIFGKKIVDVDRVHQDAIAKLSAIERLTLGHVGLDGLAHGPERKPEWKNKFVAKTDAIPFELTRADTMLAYADCNGARSFDEASKVRDLNFVSEHAVSLDEWEEIMLDATPHGYNDFDPRRVAKALRKAIESSSCFHNDFVFRPARESSVCLYIECPSGDYLPDLLYNLKYYNDCSDDYNSLADEIDESNVKIGDSSRVDAIRMWWD